MISNIGMHSFKAFSEQSLKVYPITVLLGPNNSGKSSILAVLRLLAQTVGSYDLQVPLLLSGIMGDFGTYRDIVHGNHRGRPITLSITVSTRPEDWPNRYAAQPDHSKQRQSSEGAEYKVTLEYKYRTRRRELILRTTEVRVNDKEILSTKYSDDSERHLVEKLGDRTIPPSLKASLSQRLAVHHFLPTLRLVPRIPAEGAASEFMTRDARQDAERAAHASRAVSFYLQRIDYVGAMRVPPSRAYRYSGERRDRVGPSGEYAASMLMMDEARGGARSLGMLSSITTWLKQAGIASEVAISPMSDRYYEIRVKHPVTNELQNLADVGQGNSQVLPVLVGGLHLSPGSTYLVEEPEIHLHPRAQAELGDFFLGLYANGVQSIVETHSEYLVLRLQQHVANKSIPHDHVRFYYVYPKDGRKQARELSLDAQGRFIDEWPEGFFPERLEEAKKLSRIRFQATEAGD